MHNYKDNVVPTKVKVYRTCGYCRKYVVSEEVVYDDYYKWLHGAFIQDAFPNLSDKARDFFLNSCLCGDCHDRIYKDAEEME